MAMFDMVVNGGGLLLVNYARPASCPPSGKSGSLADFAWLPDVVLLPVDTQVSVDRPRGEPGHAGRPRQRDDRQ